MNDGLAAPGAKALHDSLRSAGPVVQSGGGVAAAKIKASVALAPAPLLAACGGGGGGAAASSASATATTSGTASGGTATGGTTTGGTSTGGTTTGGTSTGGTTTGGTSTGGTTTGGTTTGGTTTGGTTTGGTSTGGTTTGTTQGGTTGGTGSTGSGSSGSGTAAGGAAAGGAATGGSTPSDGGSSTGSTGSSGDASSNGVPVNRVGPTEAEAARFLTQATMGATRASISDVMDRNFEGWIDAQFAVPRPSSLWDDLIARGESSAAKINSITGYDDAVWKQLIAGPDQLRMRVGTALLDFLVIGMPGLITNWIQFTCAGYLDILMDNAFGNYRTVLEKVTFNTGMATYLSYINNKKANPDTGAQPDENYAREIMQLFSIGLHQLNMDGSVKTSGGVPLESYTQSDVSQLARIFTGLILADGNWRTHEFGRVPLKIEPYWNETGPSTFLGKTITGGGMAAIQAALDHLFAHPNVPPFVSRQLIQRLVTSNPSPAYVGRVAAAFADNGKGERGDMKAVVKAILLDTEARNATALTSTTAGRVRTPVQRLTGWARAFGATSTSNLWPLGNLSSPAVGIGQSTGQSPSVFNFFRPGYTPPGGDIAAQKLAAPELQIANEQSIISYVNIMHKLASEGIGDIKADYAALTAKAADSAALVAEVNLLLAAGQLSAATVATIKGAVDGAGGVTARIWTAVLLTLAAPEFLVTR